MTDEIHSLSRKFTKTQSEINALLESMSAQKGVTPSIANQQTLSALGTQMNMIVVDMRQQVSGMPTANRTIWDKRTSNFENDAIELQRQIDKQIGHLFKSKKEEEERRALFGDRAGAQGGKGKDEMSNLLNERNALQQSSAMLDDMIRSGTASFDSLVGQNKTLRNAKRKLLDVATSIGVSKSLVGVIDRRMTADKWLVYGGMVLTLFILFSLWYLVRR
mmetsp:Transcript_93932/g.148416  ORF Transcript_93932/g.148416 Transcript_93932/m.148416 type:complete len:219 (-) Transcript_93932:62-718(-)